jgi:hypothetical protein
MQLDSVRELKASLEGAVLSSLAEAPRLRAFGVPAGPLPSVPLRAPTLALGIAPRADGDYQLAVRLQRRALEGHSAVEAIRKRAKGEIEIRYVGRLVKRAAPPWQQKKVRPLRMGASVGHFKITAGTLGGFVRTRSGEEPDRKPMILSNNHVLANENRAKKGDAIVQPGPLDKGVLPVDIVGGLVAFVRLKRTGANLLDCAVASLAEGLEIDAKRLGTQATRLAGVSDAELHLGASVRKVGRTTGVTLGKVTAIEMDNLIIGYDLGDLRFDQQIEIEGSGTETFSAGGDSGSLIVDDEGRAVALLFAGGDHGGSNGKGLTYANPLRSVLDALKVDLLV